MNENPVALELGMVTSNEPGLYLEDKYGIRTENLVATVPAYSTEFGEFYKFDTLTLFPIDATLMQTEIMSDDEIEWINEYHTNVREKLLPYLNEDESKWLRNKTEIIKK
jgi:Xaa-Pro aminopeptidase